jgi:hypothetical protein
MRITILRRLEALEEKYRSYEQKEWSSLRTARTYIWMIVLAYYLGDLRPEDDDPHSAYDRVVKLPRDHDFSDASIQKAGLEYRNRLNDAYCRFFAARGLDLDEAPAKCAFQRVCHISRPASGPMVELVKVQSTGHLEKLLSLAIADSPGVNVNESERERSGIIRRQFCGVRRAEAIFRGALQSYCRNVMIAPGSNLPRQISSDNFLI